MLCSRLKPWGKREIKSRMWKIILQTSQFHLSLLPFVSRLLRHTPTSHPLGWPNKRMWGEGAGWTSLNGPKAMIAPKSDKASQVDSKRNQWLERSYSSWAKADLIRRRKATSSAKPLRSSLSNVYVGSFPLTTQLEMRQVEWARRRRALDMFYSSRPTKALSRTRWAWKIVYS